MAALTLKQRIAQELRLLIHLGGTTIADPAEPNSDLRDRFGPVMAGDTLPSIRELQEHYDVARDTVRDAISVLVHEGLVIPRRGIGTVVRDITPVVVPYNPDAPSQTWQEMMGADAVDQVITVEWEAADPETAQWLGVTPGASVLHRLRHRGLAGVIVQTHHQWIVGTVVDDIRTRVGVDLSDRRTPLSTDLFVLMAQAGHRLKETVENVSSRMPDADERELMDIPLGVPATVVNRVTPEVTGEPLEVSQIVGAGDRMVYSYRMPIAKRLPSIPTDR
jgi:GntR family transcriptional regulator